MKQHLTSKDLKELSEKQRGILSKWVAEYNKRIGSYSPLDSILDTNEPELNIGQMIEFLVIDYEFKEQWLLFSRPLELCDDLWEAVKEVLENGTH